MQGPPTEPVCNRNISWLIRTPCLNPTDCSLSCLYTSQFQLSDSDLAHLLWMSKIMFLARSQQWFLRERAVWACVSPFQHCLQHKCGQGNWPKEVVCGTPTWGVDWCCPRYPGLHHLTHIIVPYQGPSRPPSSPSISWCTLGASPCSLPGPSGHLSIHLSDHLFAVSI